MHRWQLAALDPDDPRVCGEFDPSVTVVAHTACRNQVEAVAAAQRIDNPTVWFKFILPAAIVGGVAGYFIGRR